MNETRCDALAISLARRPTRRAVLRAAGALLATTTLGAGLGHAGAQGATPGACPTTTAAENVAIARRWTEDMFTGRNLSALDEIAAPDIVWDAGSFPVLHGRQAVADMVRQLFAAIPDGQYRVELTVAEGDMVAVRWTLTGTHGGPFLGVPATGTRVTTTGINIYRIRCGQIISGASEVESVGILQQIGALPTPPATPQASPVGSPGAIATPATNCAAGSEAENEALARRFFDAWSGGDPSAFAGLLSPNVVHHWGQVADTTGLAAYERQVSQYFTGFPDLAFTIDEVFGQDDLVVARWTATGTQKGAFLGIPPTGKTATWRGINIFRFACGQIVESWNETDGLGIRRQLGVLPDLVTPALSTPAA